MLKRLIILLSIPLILSACTQNNKEEIVFSSWGSITETKIIKEVISDFEKENPNLQINFIHVPQNYFQKLHLLIASNKTPDVIFINNLYLPIYASKLEDLRDIIDEKNYYPKSLKALSYNGRLLAIPRDVSNLVFYRNKNLIRKEPRNLDNLANVINIKNQYGISAERDVYYMFPYVLSMEEDIYKPKKSLEFYKNLEGNYAPKPSEIGSKTLAQMFIDGEIGLYMSGRWMYPKISEDAKFDWDVITFPGITSLDSSGWAISKDSKHKESAKKLVKYFSSKETSKKFLESKLLVPARIDIAKDIDNKIFLKAIQQSEVIKIEKDYKRVVDKMNKEFFY